MSRLSLLLLVALPLVAGCDSADPGDDLVGTWALTSVASDLRVTSRTTQSVPNVAAQPTGALSVSGVAAAQLGYVDYLYGSSDGYVQLQIASADSRMGSETVSQFFLSDSPSQSSAQYFDAQTGGYFSSFSEGPSSLTRNGNRFALAAVSLSDGSGTITVQGSLTFPEIRLAANATTAIPQPSFDELGDDAITFTFQKDGTFVLTTTEGNRAEAQSGTWEVTTDDQVRIGIRDGSITEFVTFKYAVDGRALRLEASGIDGISSCSDECLREIEGNLFADTGTLTAAESVSRYELRSSAGQATARVVTQPSRIQGRPLPKSPLLPLLGR